MKPYLYIAKIRIQKLLAYSFDVFATIGLQALVMIAMCYFWIAVYGQEESALGVSRNAMLTYTIISTAISSLFTIEVEQKIQQAVRKGSIATDLLKPVNLFGMYLAEDLADILVNFFQKTFILLVIGAIFITVPKPESTQAFNLFLLSMVLSYAINWLFSAIFGLWAFTAISMYAISALKKHIIRLLSGSIIPIWFFPDTLKNILMLLPFPYIYQLPLGIFIGKYSGQEAMNLLLLQLLWVIVLIVSFAFLSRRITKRLMVQGG